MAPEWMGLAVVRAGDEPSSDIDMSMTTLVMGSLL
jgi:hypothetical protein